MVTKNPVEAVEEALTFDSASSDEDGALAEAGVDESLTDALGTPPAEESTDPLDEIRERLQSLDGLTAQDVKSVLGQVSSFTTELDQLRDQQSKAGDGIEGRLSRTEQLNAAFAIALANSDLIADADKSAISTALMQFNQAAQNDQLNRVVDQRVAAATGASVTTPQQGQQAAAVTEAIKEINEYADEIGIGRDRIPQAVWDRAEASLRATSVTRALRGAVNDLDALQGESDKTKRTAGRKTAAGKGTTPAGKVGYSTMDEADDLRLKELITHEEYKVARKKFGIKDSPR